MSTTGTWTPWSDTYDDLSQSQLQALYFFKTVTYTIPLTETDGCNLPSNTMYITDDGNILYNSSVGINTFQLDVIGGTLTGASGGAAATNEFTITTNAQTIIGSTLTENPISGCGELIVAEFSSGSPLSLSNITIITTFGTEVDFNYLNSLIGPEDWVAAFRPANVCTSPAYINQGPCEAAGETWLTEKTLVGAKQWDYDLCGGNICELAIMGDDNSGFGTDNYMQNGEIPTFQIYNAADNIFYAAYSSAAVPGWQNMDTLIFDNLSAEEAIGGTITSFYSTHYGNNLISFPMDLGAENTPEDLWGLGFCQNWPEWDRETCELMFNEGGSGSPWVTPFITDMVGEGVATTFDVASDSWTGSLNTINPLMGYWVKVVSGSGSFSISGDSIGNPTYNWHTGANLVSFPGSEESFVGNHFVWGPNEPESPLISIIGEGEAMTLEYLCNDPQYIGQGACEADTDCNGTGLSCIWFQAAVGSLAFFKPNHGYWIDINTPLSDFQFNLTLNSRCSNTAYTDQSSCEGANSTWRIDLINA